MDIRDLEADPRLYMYTSLTAGSSHILTATSRLDTILKANRLPYITVDLATNEACKKLWARRAGKRKLPALVKEGFIVGDLQEVEDWNEFGELKEVVGPVPSVDTVPGQAVAKKDENMAPESTLPIHEKAGDVEFTSKTSNMSHAPTSDAKVDGTTSTSTTDTKTDDTTTTSTQPATAENDSVATVVAPDSITDPIAAPNETVPDKTENTESNTDTPTLVHEATQEEVEEVERETAIPEDIEAEEEAEREDAQNIKASNATDASTSAAERLEDDERSEVTAGKTENHDANAVDDEPSGSAAALQTSTHEVSVDKETNVDQTKAENVNHKDEESEKQSVDAQDRTEAVTERELPSQTVTGDFTKEQRAADGNLASTSVGD